MEKELKEFGLNNNEIKVYKATLELGSSTVTNIAKRADIYRTLTYEVLKSLSEKGLVSWVIKDRKKYFEAASPKKFIQILKAKEDAINNILPKMLALEKSVKTKPSITLYEGKEGIRTVLENLLTEAKEIYVLNPKKSMFKAMEYYFPNFFQKRIEKKIKVKTIVDEKPYTTTLLEYKILKKKFSTGYWIYNDKVIISSFSEKDPLAILIENEEFAKTMKMTFKIMWDSIQ